MWLNEWQRSQCGAALAGPGGHEPCQGLGTTVPRERSNWKHSTGLSKGLLGKLLALGA